MEHLSLRDLIIMLNSLAASTCKFGVLKMAFSLFSKDPSEQISLLNISTNFQKQSFDIAVKLLISAFRKSQLVSTARKI